MTEHGNSEPSHSDVIREEIRICREHLKLAEDGADAAKVAQFLRLLSQLNRELEKACMREQSYLRASDIAAADQQFIAAFIDDMRGYLQKLYDHEITPDEAWAQLVDKAIESMVDV